MHTKHMTNSGTKATNLPLAMVLCDERPTVLLRWFDPDEHDIPMAKSVHLLENIFVRFHLDDRQHSHRS